jgi:hypothetical protein
MRSAGKAAFRLANELSFEHTLANLHARLGSRAYVLVQWDY